MSVTFLFPGPCRIEQSSPRKKLSLLILLSEVCCFFFFLCAHARCKIVGILLLKKNLQFSQKHSSGSILAFSKMHFSQFQSRQWWMWVSNQTLTKMPHRRLTDSGWCHPYGMAGTFETPAVQVVIQHLLRHQPGWMVRKTDKCNIGQPFSRLLLAEKPCRPVRRLNGIASRKSTSLPKGISCLPFLNKHSRVSVSISWGEKKRKRKAFQGKFFCDSGERNNLRTWHRQPYQHELIWALLASWLNGWLREVNREGSKADRKHPADH